MQSSTDYVNQHKDRFLNELIELLKIPSISADSAFSQDVINTAEVVEKALIEAGCDLVEICETDGYPIVYGEKIIDPKLPTVLVYGHYDVQPPDPLDLWDSPPFEPVIKETEEHPEGAIFARGASDDKGQMYMHVKALEFMVRNNQLPCNVKFMIEGEEEVGSVNIAQYVANNKEKLKNAKKDVVIMHPGSTNRGVELSAEVADGEYSVILDQVTNGVAVRMAVMYLLLGAKGKSIEDK